MPDSENPFWKTKSFKEMTLAEWESLCDGCGLCCLYKLEDDDTREVLFTNIACKYLDQYSCRCKEYEQRQKVMPTCVNLTPNNVQDIAWLPKTCAYRLLREGKDLPWWHPLISGDDQSVHLAGLSIRGKAIPEDMVDLDRLDDYVVQWIE